jgi:hypothetical protein
VKTIQRWIAFSGASDPAGAQADILGALAPMAWVEEVRLGRGQGKGAPFQDDKTFGLQPGGEGVVEVRLTGMWNGSIGAHRP